MGSFESEGIILRSYNLAEADKIVVVLTRDRGLIRGVAKGAKRLQSKFGGGLEPFSIVQISYFQKETSELASINQIELVKSYFSSAGDPAFLQKFSYLADLLIEFAPPHDPDETLYRMAKVCLETGSNMPEGLESIAVYFEIWILRLSGFLPNWNDCDKCSKDLAPNEPAGLQFSFQLVCDSCSLRKGNLTVSPNQRLLFMCAQKLAPENFVEFSREFGSELSELSVILRRVIAQVLGRETVGEKLLTAHL